MGFSETVDFEGLVPGFGFPSERAIYTPPIESLSFDGPEGSFSGYEPVDSWFGLGEIVDFMGITYAVFDFPGSPGPWWSWAGPGSEHPESFNYYSFGVSGGDIVRLSVTSAAYDQVDSYQVCIGVEFFDADENSLGVAYSEWHKDLNPQSRVSFGTGDIQAPDDAAYCFFIVHASLQGGGPWYIQSLQIDVIGDDAPEPEPSSSLGDLVRRGFRLPYKRTELEENMLFVERQLEQYLHEHGNSYVRQVGFRFPRRDFNNESAKMENARYLQTQLELYLHDHVGGEKQQEVPNE